MKIEIRQDGKKISKKAAAEKIGKEMLEKRIQDAVEEFWEDPLTLCSWMDGMEIKVDPR